ncbi:hypothetical protein VNI00_003575 [Paramarasmius palmivorus]|uniref:Uncharacterized protein n=1 Tax=Paramarasmius palmivorus TaxID=297713 RepID=A0AAW0DU04_9AGAR
MSSLIYRLGRPSITRRESTRIAVSSSTEAISPGSEDLILEDNILPVRSSLLTTSIVSPLRRAMKLSGVLEGVSSSVGSTSHHTSSPRRKQLQVHSMEQTSKPDRTAKNLNTTPHTISKHAPSELPDLEIQVYLPVMQLTEPEIPLELKVHSETTVKDLISLSVDQDPRLTGNWTLRPVQDHFVDYEHQAPDPLDRVRLLDSRAFALSLANSEDDRRIRPTHRRCYTLPSNGNALLDMPSNVPGQLQAGAKYFRVRVDLAKSAESLQIYVYAAIWECVSL